jgi:hypothetical protein
LTLIAAAVIAPAIAHADVSLSVSIAPPALPVYVQPPIPGDGYMWTPGYWSWNADDNDYYWVPGTWVVAPFVGALWTPGYWGWGGGGYAWHGGYWGSHIGYYGGINYGFGYDGVGYQGGYWNNGAFRYNRSVNNVGRTHITNVYNSTVVNHNAPNRVSYNGGNGGIRRQPSRGEENIANMPHNGPTAPQAQHEQAARSNSVLRASVNHGVPRVAATPEPGAFNAPNVVAARPAPTWQNNRPNNGNVQRPQAPPQQRAAPRPQPTEQAMPRPQPMQRAAPQENMRQESHPAQPRQSAPRPAGPQEDHRER